MFKYLTIEVHFFLFIHTERGNRDNKETRDAQPGHSELLIDLGEFLDHSLQVTKVFPQ